MTPLGGGTVKRALAVPVALAGLVILGFGIREAARNWTELWRWWVAGGVAVPGQLALTIVLVVFGVGIVGAAWQMWEEGRG
jgi:hypothetical protein